MNIRSFYLLSARTSITAMAGLLVLGLSSFACADPTVPVAPPATTMPASQPAGTYTLTDPETKHLERQAQVALAAVNDALNANPPAEDVPVNRALALTLMDSILHDPGAPQRPAVATFRMLRTNHAIADMMLTKVTDDSVMIWQIYNMGFVIRTKSVTLGFDLVELSHMPVIALDDDTMQAIVNQCDVLFVSHEHLDHADHKVAQMFLDAGKPVLAPDAMWKGEPLHDRLTHLPRDGKADGHPLQLAGGKPSLNVSIYPGYQHVKEGEDVEDNVYVVTTAEGIRVAHTGDNNVPPGLPPTGRDSAIKPVDILVMKFEPGKLRMGDIIPPFSPKLVLPSHFEELGHANVNAREPYWRGMERAARTGYPTVLMAWGERFHYVRTKN